MKKLEEEITRSILEAVGRSINLFKELGQELGHFADAATFSERFLDFVGVLVRTGFSFVNHDSLFDVVCIY